MGIFLFQGELVFQIVERIILSLTKRDSHCIMNIIHMRTTLSFTLTPTLAKKTRELVKLRGFSTVSDYIRFLLQEDDVAVISEAELVKRAKEISKLEKSGKLIRAKSMADFR